MKRSLLGFLAVLLLGVGAIGSGSTPAGASDAAASEVTQAVSGGQDDYRPQARDDDDRDDDDRDRKDKDGRRDRDGERCAGLVVICL